MRKCFRNTSLFLSLLRYHCSIPEHHCMGTDKQGLFNSNHLSHRLNSDTVKILPVHVCDLL